MICARRHIASVAVAAFVVTAASHCWSRKRRGVKKPLQRTRARNWLRAGVNNKAKRCIDEFCRDASTNPAGAGNKTTLSPMRTAVVDIAAPAVNSSCRPSRPNTIGLRIIGVRAPVFIVYPSATSHYDVIQLDNQTRYAACN